MASPANRKKAPPIVIPLYNDIKVIDMTPLVTLLTATPILAPCARSLNGNISELYTHVIGPIPIEKNATYDSTIATASTTAHIIFS